MTGVAVPTLNGVLAYGEDAEREVVCGLLERVAAAGVPHCLQLAPGCSGALRELGEGRGMRRAVDVPLHGSPKRKRAASA